jgi:hypothetical protein
MQLADMWPTSLAYQFLRIIVAIGTICRLPIIGKNGSQMQSILRGLRQFLLNRSPDALLAG